MRVMWRCLEGWTFSIGDACLFPAQVCGVRASFHFRFQGLFNVNAVFMIVLSLPLGRTYPALVVYVCFSLFSVYCAIPVVSVVAVVVVVVVWLPARPIVSTLINQTINPSFIFPTTALQSLPIHDRCVNPSCPLYLQYAVVLIGAFSKIWAVIRIVGSTRASQISDSANANGEF